MRFTRSDIQKIANLACLSIKDDVADELIGQFDKIIKLVEKMNESPTEHVNPIAHPFEVTQPLRTDNVTEENQRDLLLAIAPLSIAGLFIVPQFVETE